MDDKSIIDIQEVTHKVKFSNVALYFCEAHLKNFMELHYILSMTFVPRPPPYVISEFINPIDATVRARLKLGGKMYCEQCQNSFEQINLLKLRK